MPPTPPRPARPSGEQHALVHGDQRAVVVEVGGGVRRYAVGDWEVLDGYRDDEMCSGARGQPLIPWPNRLRDGRYRFRGREHALPLSEPERRNAIHGLVRWAGWTAQRTSESRVTMRHTLHPQPGYPFTLALAIDYVLDDDGLTVTTTMLNAGAEACPVGAGAHPYLSLGAPTIDDALLEAPGRTWMPTDERGIPVDERPVDGGERDFRASRPIGRVVLDTAFADLVREDDGRAHVRLSSPNGGRSVDLWLGEGYDYLMLFTGDSLPDEARRRRGLGVEPMTCAPNALATGRGLRALEPGERLRVEWGVAPRRTA